MCRPDTWLGAEPSGIATVAAQANFLAKTRLHPSDSILAIKAKLDGLRFRFLPHGSIESLTPPRCDSDLVQYRAQHAKLPVPPFKSARL